jgi:pyridoxal phosphate enzyme (YggS family)
VSIAGHLASVRARSKDAVLVAVSKNHSRETVIEALAAGQMVFGENRVQEAQKKFSGLCEQYPGIELHLIGPLQTNKAEDAVRLFDVIETLDRPKLAEALAAAIKKTGRTPRLYIEVNIGDEAQKAGISPAQLSDFLGYCRDQCGLTVSGLMCIPPQGQDARPHFKAMRKLADQFTLPHLSMGMSADFEAAIECGTTEVRVGTAIFGVRK